MKTKNEQLKDEFQLFLSADEIRPPQELSAQLQNQIALDLNPPFFNVLLKVLGVHALVSVFSLSLCSQFGFQTFSLLDLMNQFMKAVGSTYCMAFCGAIYLGISALALSLLLRPQDVRVIRQNIILQMTLMTGLSLGVFLCLGASLLFVPVVLWIVGAFVGGIGTLELGWMIRSQFRKRLVYGI